MNVWHFRRKIQLSSVYSVTGISENLNNFPVLIACDSDIVLSSARSNGGDIRFTLEDGTKLDYWIEYWRGGGGTPVTMRAWVKIPVLDASNDTIIYIYWGNLAASSTGKSAAPWDGNFVLVSDCADGSTNTKMHIAKGDIKEADKYVNENEEPEPKEISLPAGKAQRFETALSRVTVDDSNSLRITGAITVEVIIKPNETPTAYRYIIGKGNAFGGDTYTGAYVLCVRFDTNSNKAIFRFSIGCPGKQASVESNARENWHSAENWYHFAGVWTGEIGSGQLKLYLNDSDFPASPVPDNFSNGLKEEDIPVRIGRGNVNSLLCDLDHVRISNVARSDAWLKYTSNNYFSPLNYQTLGKRVDLNSSDSAFLLLNLL